MNKKKLKARFKAAEKIYDATYNELELAALYTYPHTLLESDHERVDQAFLCDTTLREGLRSLVSNVTNLQTPQDRRWGGIGINESEFPDGVPDENREFTEAQSERMFEFIRDSNFKNAEWETVIDEFSIGTGAIVPSINDEDKLHFEAIPLKQLRIIENKRTGVIDTVFRVNALPARDIVAQAKWSPSDKVRRKADKSPEEEIIIVESFVPKDGRTREWEYIVSEKDNAWHQLFSEDFDWRKIVAHRNDKRSGQTWGWSIARDNLPHAMTLNALTEYILDHDEATAKPLLWSRDAHTQQEELQNGQWISGSEVPQTVILAGDISTSFADLQRLQQRLLRALHADAFPPLERPSNMTATEFLGRQRQFITQVAPFSDRMDRELYKPLLHSVFRLLQKTGKLASVDPQGRPFVMDGKPYRIITNSLVAQAQQIEEVQKHFVALEQFALFGPALFQGFRVDRFIPWALKEMGIQSAFINEEQLASSLQNGSPEQLQGIVQNFLGIANQTASQSPGALNNLAANISNLGGGTA